MTGRGQTVYCVDAKLTFDDNAAYRQKVRKRWPGWVERADHEQDSQACWANSLSRTYSATLIGPRRTRARWRLPSSTSTTWAWMATSAAWVRRDGAAIVRGRDQRLTVDRRGRSERRWPGHGHHGHHQAPRGGAG